MEKIDEQLNNISLVEVPVGIHSFVMQKVNQKKLQPVFFAVFVILALNFIVIGWHINAKLIDAEFVDMMQDLLEVFSFNFSFLKIAILSFFEIVSPLLVISLLLSLTGTIFSGKRINFSFSS